MKTFHIYKDQRWGDDDVAWAYEAVKVGFSWPALFLGPFWALAKGLWGIAAFLLVLTIIAATAEATAAQAYSYTTWLVHVIADATWLVIAVVAGFRGNRWRIPRLERSGYEWLTTVEALSAKEALRPFHAANEKT